MRKNYSDLIKGINLRSNPKNYQMTKMFSDTISGSKLFESAGIQYDDVIDYIKVAMQGVPREYTNQSKAAANLVEACLKESHGDKVTFKRQGSIMTNTHILNDHDIDLLQITSKSSDFDHSGLNKALADTAPYTKDEVINLKKAKENFTKYNGNQLSDLGLIRLKSETALSKAYKNVDNSKNNCICVKSEETACLIDVVTATFYKGVGYLKSTDQKLKGIQIYNKQSNSTGKVDYPFLSIARINERHLESMKRFKDMIRFLKNVKYDCPYTDNKGAIRSFHINAICYNIKVERYKNLHYVDIVDVLYEELEEILTNKAYRDAINSVDGCESIFEVDCEKKLVEIKFLQDEIDSILADLNISTKLIG
jgi:hypothetical protein